MRRFIYMCFCLLMIACSKESTLESRINLDELYVIQDDPDDPVKHRIYEIYETYGIPVYFNDTIGRIKQTSMGNRFINMKNWIWLGDTIVIKNWNIIISI